ncbi:serine hydrolase domain-containing protein [Lysinibacillus cavernae]|uniref:serine hydrolase domain-containing protein n=1 Tax=Lysinibacillus cavernae TaxID=2666135 RepID=UPI0012D9A767|nr:serine hydrolase [Lysinibacillus cavernae]
MNTKLQNIVMEIQQKMDFSGTVLVENQEKVALVNQSFGYANRSEQIENNAKTRFGIASGCKLFTAIAICQLIEKGKLTLDTKLSECLNHHFKQFDEQVTIFHLLTHTSGIPDYFDEEEMENFEELWIDNPMYQLRKLSDFLPLFQNRAMKYKVGNQFHYNNAGYILLGLIVEHASGMLFSDYIQRYIFDQANMTESGYFSLDSLPSNTALGYIDNQDGTWKTNIYSLPVKGGSDGGAFVTVNDMAKLWHALMNFELLNEVLTNQLLLPQVEVNESGCYGYGVWMKKNSEQSILKYHVMGYDPGVCFHSAYYPDSSIKVVVCSNKSNGAFDIMKGIEEELARMQNL